ncbi:endolytic transglycosylase MltG [Heliorestis acidaminivorans]|uniref:Endolytic transglycosylase MltG n=1 Tax=Heliorestis acidaminivorans TaxID=553427 RepID=A0A6I0F308_9FIRM|nr:endolytic transglycosylase MltG [Heliorestis acidaminivorans]KAB2954371.1 endolytic transglycosylase MltG [Heliorestis acidaminivorans]
MGTKHPNEQRTFSTNRFSKATDGRVLFAIGLLFFILGLLLHYAGPQLDRLSQERVGFLEESESKKEPVEEEYEEENISFTEEYVEEEIVEIIEETTEETTEETIEEVIEKFVEKYVQKAVSSQERVDFFEEQENEQEAVPMEQEAKDLSITEHVELETIKATKNEVTLVEDNLTVVMDKVEAPVATYHEFTIFRGDTSEKVAKRLEEAGLIDNSQQFNSFMILQNYVRTIKVGTYYLSRSMSYEEMAAVITGRQ